MMTLFRARMLLGANCVVVQFACNLTKAKDMVKNMTARATVLLYVIFWSCQGRFTINCAELFVVCVGVGSTGVDHVDGVARDPARDWSSEAVVRDNEISPIMSNCLLVWTQLMSIRLVNWTVLVFVSLREL